MLDAQPASPDWIATLREEDRLWTRFGVLESISVAFDDSEGWEAWKAEMDGYKSRMSELIDLQDGLLKGELEGGGRMSVHPPGYDLIAEVGCELRRFQA
jgi:hypothetical protein